jgi:SAM-dependent methyltransferase
LDEAIPWLEEAVSLEPAVTFLANLAIAYARSGQDAQAERAFCRALQLAPDDQLLLEDFATFTARRRPGSTARLVDPAEPQPHQSVLSIGGESASTRAGESCAPWLAAPPGWPGTTECADAGIGSVTEYAQHRLRKRETYMRWAAREQAWSHADVTSLPGFCGVCREPQAFAIVRGVGTAADGGADINWRETLTCPGCGLNNRSRAALHFVTEKLRASPASRIYIAEQATPVYAWLRQRFPHIVGSEYVDATLRSGSVTAEGLRHEDLTALSLPTARFDFVMAFDIFEHVPDYAAGFRECCRVLGPGGRLVVTVPFAPLSFDHCVRASLDGAGRVIHHLPAEYHGDPVRRDGCLCYQVFGWQLLADLRRAGFTDVVAHLYWAETYGYLGGEQALFVATKRVDASEVAQEARWRTSP